MKPLVLLMVALLLICTLLSVCIGHHLVSPASVWRSLSGTSEGDGLRFVLLEIRIPRSLTAVLAGASLGVAGAAMQGVLRNPLADPGLLGVSAGASLFASAYIGFGAGMMGVWVGWGTAFSASLGGLLAMAIVVGISYQRYQVQTSIIILAGVAVNALAGALTTLVIYWSDPERMRNMLFWTMGQLGKTTWPGIWVLLAGGVIGSVLVLLHLKALDAMMLGEQAAQSLGYRTIRARWLVIAGAAILVGTCVAMCGAIGFVGLAVPHIARMIFGARHLWVVPMSALTGAVILLVADVISRTVIAPSELPVGAVTALFGAPFFLYLLIQSKRHTIS